MQNSVTLHPIQEDQVKLLMDLAKEIWPKTYAQILSQDQIDYMMDLMYSEARLKNDLKAGIIFYFIVHHQKNIGFTAIELKYKNTEQLYIHKIYLHPKAQGLGLGKACINLISEIAQNNGLKHISLNVNRFNQAKLFYQKVGFEVIGEEDIDIGNGYYMNDFIMQKKV